MINIKWLALVFIIIASGCVTNPRVSEEQKYLKEYKEEIKKERQRLLEHQFDHPLPDRESMKIRRNWNNDCHKSKTDKDNIEPDYENQEECYPKDDCRRDGLDRREGL